MKQSVSNSYELETAIKPKARNIVKDNIVRNISSNKLTMLTLPGTEAVLEKELTQIYPDTTIFCYEKDRAKRQKLLRNTLGYHQFIYSTGLIQNHVFHSKFNAAFIDLCGAITYNCESDTLSPFLHLAQRFGEACNKKSVFAITFNRTRGNKEAYLNKHYGPNFFEHTLPYWFQEALCNVKRTELINYKNNDVKTKANEMLTYIFSINK